MFFEKKISVSWEEAGALTVDGVALVWNVPKESLADSFNEILYFHFFVLSFGR